MAESTPVKLTTLGAARVGETVRVTSRAGGDGDRVSQCLQDWECEMRSKAESRRMRLFSNLKQVDEISPDVRREMLLLQKISQKDVGQVFASPEKEDERVCVVDLVRPAWPLREKPLPARLLSPTRARPAQSGELPVFAPAPKLTPRSDDAESQGTEPEMDYLALLCAQCSAEDAQKDEPEQPSAKV